MNWVPFLEAFSDITSKYSKIPKSDFLERATYPIIDQGRGQIAGYFDDKSFAFDGGEVVVFGDHTRAVKFAQGPFALGADGTKVLLPREGMLPRYLYRWLQAQDIPSLGYSRHFKLLKDLSVPVPAWEVQRRIADILDKADALRAKRREAIAHLDAFGQSIFHYMFSGDSKQTATLGEILKVSSGKFLPAKSMTMGGQYPVYGGNGINGFHDHYVVEEATLVVGRVGANCGAVHLTQPKSWITDNALQVKKLRPLVDEYLLFALRQADLNQYANVSGQPSISGASIYRVPISVPAFDMQQEFARRIATVELLKTTHREQLVELDNLFLSLRDRAFKRES